MKPTPDISVDHALKASAKAFHSYGISLPSQRNLILKTIAARLEIQSAELVRTASSETFLDEERLRSELNRALFQLRSYGEAIVNGSLAETRKDAPDPNRHPPKPSLLKIMVPLGPVVVFGASNFPFAYSTAGGDTACALAAGCSVIVKAHPAHPRTSEMVAAVIKEALKELNMDEDIFMHLHGDIETGKALVQHPYTRAVAFTGSLEGGRAIFDLANRRKVPIPVFAEMGSVNPVFILPGKLNDDPALIAAMLARSITQSAGQFCTSPGILVGIESEALLKFENLLGNEIEKVFPQKMLHPGIAEHFVQNRQMALTQQGVQTLSVPACQPAAGESIPTLASVPAHVFLKNPVLHKEIFGPFSLLVKCKDLKEMNDVAASMEGQLTSSLFATPGEIIKQTDLVRLLARFSGRIILNGVPTGVEVSMAMHHGGPYPATTDSRFTAVGPDGIRRFLRPLCFQNWYDDLIPDHWRPNPLIEAVL